jgi:hypothetical protein
MRHHFLLVTCLLVLFSITSGCGAKRQNSDSEVTNTPVELAFLKASSLSGVPVRFLMATGYIESGLRAERSSANYLQDGQSVNRSPSHGETAFGFSYSELGIDPANSPSLTDQIAAYGEFLKARLADSKPALAAVTPEEKMRWIWSIAKIHRGSDAPKNLLAVFSRELISVLNTGFVVQDQDGVFASLDKEATPLRDQDLPLNYREDLQLDMYNAQIRSASLFSLARTDPNEGVSHPKSIEVVHCPFTLSTCIQLQQVESGDTAPMGAHYLIPSSDSEVPGILQFARHDEIVSLIGADGNVEHVNNRIIVMLAGSSGRYKDGQRAYADPLWMTDFQLRLLGAAVNEICAVLVSSEGVNRDQCVGMEGANGVQFRRQKLEFYRWGDVSDFDETIIGPYLSNKDGISASTTLQISPEGSPSAGSTFRLNAGFQSTARRVELERLVRCSSADRRVVWEPVDQRQVRNVSSHSFENVWYDAGPNGTGDQYFRVKSSGENGKFMGWSTKRVQLKNFEKNNIPEVPSKYCLRNGS